MSLKTALRKYASDAIGENHQSMDSGLSSEKYNRLVGENAAYSKILDQLAEYKEPDSDGLEELPE